MILNKERWLRLWQSAGLEGDASLRFDELVRLYSEPQRHYHNLQHIADCLREFDGARGLARDPIAMEFAIWLHDVIYDPHAHNNEEASAKLAGHWIAEGQGARGLIQSVSVLIRATQHTALPTKADAQLMVDIDLSILGQDESRFQQYETQIRQEYLWVPESLFASKRAEILEGFMARERIFLTPPFYQKYEAVARRNLSRAITRWRQ